jgi:hypothetical protein
MEFIYNLIIDEAQDRANEIVAVDEDDPKYLDAYDEAFNNALSDIVDNILNHFNIE